MGIVPRGAVVYDDACLSSVCMSQKLKMCSVNGCERAARCKGFCGMHYRRWKDGGDPGTNQPKTKKLYIVCSINGCNRQVQKQRLCSMHLRRLGHSRPVGSCHTRSDEFRLNGSLTTKGYRVIYRPDHPNANKHGAVAEHVAVMSERLGRPLRPGETVHHINGIRDDNRLENLELWTRSHPPGQRITDRIADAVELLKVYQNDPCLWPSSSDFYFPQLAPDW